MTGCRVASFSSAEPHFAFHSSSCLKALSKAVRHSAGSRCRMLPGTALSPLNEERKSAWLVLSYVTGATPAGGPSMYVSMTQKFRDILRGTGGNLALPSVAASSFGDTCSMRTRVGCIVAGYCKTFVWMSYTPLLFNRRIALMPELKMLSSDKS
jgi:hypothetical protein